MERVPRPVDDGLEELVPCACGGGQAGDVMDEPELIELADVVASPAGSRRPVRPRHRRSGGRGSPGTGPKGRPSLRHAHHDTRVGTVGPGNGCDPVAGRLRYRRGRPSR